MENLINERDAEIALLMAELTDSNKPSVYMTELTSLVCLMIEDNMAFVKKNGLTKKAEESRQRLLRILELSEEFNKISRDNHLLKGHVKTIYGILHLTKRQLIEANKKIAQMESAFKEL